MLLGCVIKPCLQAQQGIQRDNGMWSRGDLKEYPGQPLAGLSQESHSLIKKVIKLPSQNARMVEAGSNLWTLSGPTPLQRQGYLKHVAHDYTLMTSE